MTSSYGTCEDKCAIVSHAIAGELDTPCKGSLIWWTKEGYNEELMNQLRVVKLEPFDMLVLLFERSHSSRMIR